MAITEGAAKKMSALIEQAAEAWNAMIDIARSEQQAGNLSEGMEEAMYKMADVVAHGVMWFDVRVADRFTDPTKEDFGEALRMFGAPGDEIERQWERKKNRYTPRNQFPKDNQPSTPPIAVPPSQSVAEKTADEGKDTGQLLSRPLSLEELEAMWEQ